jgi:hypothetical protein
LALPSQYRRWGGRSRVIKEKQESSPAEMKIDGAFEASLLMSILCPPPGDVKFGIRDMFQSAEFLADFYLTFSEN